MQLCYLNIALNFMQNKLKEYGCHFVPNLVKLRWLSIDIESIRLPTYQESNTYLPYLSLDMFQPSK